MNTLAAEITTKYNEYIQRDPNKIMQFDPEKITVAAFNLIDTIIDAGLSYHNDGLKLVRKDGASMIFNLDYDADNNITGWTYAHGLTLSTDTLDGEDPTSLFEKIATTITTWAK